MTDLQTNPADEMSDGDFSEMMQEAGSEIETEAPEAPEEEEESEDGYELDEEDAEPEEEAEEDAEEEESEEETEEDAAPELDDETEIDVATGEDGEPVKAKLADLKEAFKNAETVRKAAADLGAKFQELKEKHDGLEDAYRQAAMEAQSEVDAYNGVDWMKLARENPENYAKHRAYYDQMIQKRDAVKAKFESWKEENQKAAQAERMQKAQASLRILQNDIGFNQEIHESVRDYALKGLGFDAKNFDDIIDASTYKAIYYAMQYQKGIREKNAKIKPKQNRNKAVSGKGARSVASKPKASPDGAVALPQDFSEWGME